jgi:hypothetical protein
MFEITCICGRGFGWIDDAVQHVEEIHSGEFADRQHHGWSADYSVVEKEIASRIRITSDASRIHDSGEINNGNI